MIYSNQLNRWDIWDIISKVVSDIRQEYGKVNRIMKWFY
jgi:hypothetical protein